MQRTAQILCVAAVPLLLAGCATSSHELDGRVTEQGLGRWNGPEGTYLDITGTPADYRLSIVNLDGPRRFVGGRSSASVTVWWSASVPAMAKPPA